MNKEFKEIEINPNYSISKTGEVYSKYSNKIISPYKMNSGYLSVKLQVGNKKQAFLIHRLVLLTWGEKLDGKDFCNHIDGDKLNNSIDNLEWVTKSENGKHAYKTGLKLPVMMIGKDNPSFKYDEIIRLRINELYKNGYRISQINRTTGVSRTHIYRILGLSK